RAGYKVMMAQLRAAFPDLEVTIEDQVAEGDKVVTRYTMRGTHQGELWGIPASGNRFELEGINIDRVVDGRFSERWAAYDQGELMRQLSVSRPG
ncbi:MAG: ester cyclase, partial [Chloroflexota bacterium]|nr:ester cyclase [Chloroflexota bacterium]